MKKMPCKVSTVALGVIVLQLVFLGILVGCNQPTAEQTVAIRKKYMEDETRKDIAKIRYGQDPRTLLCFAFSSNVTPYEVMTVPCESVKHLLPKDSK
jgi:hypothetical protein